MDQHVIHAIRDMLAERFDSGRVRPEFLRLPTPGDRCLYTSLSRSTLNELTIPGPANGFNPPVKSVLVKKRGASRGIRLINYDSLMAHLHSLQEDEASNARE